FLVEELKAIQGNLPEITQYSGGQKARINKSAAKVLLAKVYLQRAAGHPPGVSSQGSDLSNAESLLREVMQTGNYGLVEDYGSLFSNKSVNERNKEAIFTVEHAKFSGQGTVVENWISPRNSNWGIGQWTAVTSNFDFYTSYNSGDERKEASWITEYKDPDGVTRKFDPFNPEADNYQEDGASLAKHTYRGGSNIGWTQGWRDWMHFRYADVLLMLAETINRQGGPTSEAYDLVDQVRTRANAPNLTRGLNQAQFSDSLYHERMWELSQELHGWRDCQRFFEECKKLVENSADRGVQDPDGVNRRPTTDITIETPKHRLWPIPAPAMSRNPALSQNEGYN
ncbi:MAG: RagB/SusD family nutrient uptake outer membrane protein, partial [Salinibacter sp.]